MAAKGDAWLLLVLIGVAKAPKAEGVSLWAESATVRICPARPRCSVAEGERLGAPFRSLRTANLVCIDGSMGRDGSSVCCDGPCALEGALRLSSDGVGAGRKGGERP